MTAATASPPPDGCSPKRRQILAGARRAFCEMGFERASVDLIAAEAGVSKATVYNHFHDKKALFVACYSEQADELREGVHRALQGEPAGELEPALQAVGEQLLALLLTPAIVSLYRYTSAEAARFPEIGQILFDRGPAVLRDKIAGYLQRWAERGALRLDDPRAAAQDFLMLCHGDLVIRAQLGILQYPAGDDVGRTVARAVAVFLRAYASAGA
jgi:TetR/AcrR family transcriptional repressor of mexJK operon